MFIKNRLGLLPANLVYYDVNPNAHNTTPTPSPPAPSPTPSVTYAPTPTPVYIAPPPPVYTPQVEVLTDKNLTPQKTTPDYPPPPVYAAPAPAVISSRSELVPTYSARTYDDNGNVLDPGGTTYSLTKNSTGAASTAADSTPPDLSVPAGVAYSDAAGSNVVVTTPDAPAVSATPATDSPSIPWGLIVTLASALFLN